MTTIGIFKAQGNDYEGHIETRLWHNAITIKAVAKASEKAPDYRVFAGRYEIGAAWKKTSESAGTTYLSVKIDDPSFPAPLNASLKEAEDHYALIWNRA